MIPILLNNLPMLVILIIGIAMALDRKNKHPQLAAWATVCYGVLIAVWVMRMIQFGWIVSAHQQGIEIRDHQVLLTALGYFRMVVSYIVLAALVIGALRWRQGTGDHSQKPGILAGVSIFLTIAGTVLARSLTGASPLSLLVLICELGSMITLMIAFYGWRSYEDVPVPNTDHVISGPDAQKPAPLQSGMFEEKDFIPFVLGVMILGGMGCIPVIWGQLTQMGYAKAVIPSLISCGIFVYAHDNRGNFSILKFLAGMLFVFMIVLRAMAQSGGNTKPMFFAGGIVGYIIMFACGWAGIALVRTFRRKSGGEK